jgi:hypothetical protein
MHFRFRVVLPVIFGFLAAILMLWDYENNRMVALMGMGWDTGPPFWPYQAIHTALSGINAPAFVISFPILKMLNLQNLTFQYAVWLPPIAGWWWYVGTRIDFGILGRRRFHHPKTLAGFLIVASLICGYLGVSIALQEVHWWLRYAADNPSYRLPTLLTAAGPVVWSLVLAVGCAVASVRLLRMNVWPRETRLVRYRSILFVVPSVALYVFGIHLWDEALLPHFNHDECEIDRLYGLGCVHGTVIDESGNPVSRVEVDLIPARARRDERWYAANTHWTDEKGRYNLNRRDAGDYILGVNAFDSSGAPDADRPYATAYYPNAESEAEAVPVRIERSAALYLTPIRLHKLDMATLKINVLWSDGTQPQRSNIYFKNWLYLHQAVTAPQIDNGVGEYRLPLGLKYESFASVACDGGTTIESRESLPYQWVKVAVGQIPADVTFVTHGPPCLLWEPN